MAEFCCEKNVKREKGLTRNSRKYSKIKGLVTHTFSKKKKNERTEKEKKKNCRKRKTEDVFSDLLEKTTFFQIHQNRKGINEKLNV